MTCGCIVAVDYDDTLAIVYCPKHEAAPELYEALELTRNNLQTLSDAALHYKKTFSANLEILNQVLSEARGEK